MKINRFNVVAPYLDCYCIGDAIQYSQIRPETSLALPIIELRVLKRIRYLLDHGGHHFSFFRLVYKLNNVWVQYRETDRIYFLH